MAWPGVHDETGAVGEGMEILKNASLVVPAEIRRRPGLAERQDLGGPALSEVRDAVNGQFVVVRDTPGNIKTSKPGGPVSTIKSSLNTAIVGSFTKANGRLYYGNDFDPVVVIDSSTGTAADAGIEAPDSWDSTPAAGGSGGVITAGDHLLRYRWYNSKSGYWSNPSAAVTVTVTAGQTITLTWTTHMTAPSDTKVDQIIVEMTLASGTAYYVAKYANVASSGTVVIDISDDSLQQQDIIDEDSDLPLGHAEPPLADLLAEHRGRLFAMSTSVRTITVGVTNASATVTSSAAFSTGWAGRLIEINGVRYRILSVASTSSLTLSENYAGSTNASISASVYAVNRDMLYWSYPNRPESWRTGTRARRVFQNQSDVPTAIASFYEYLLIFGQRTLRALSFTDDPSRGQLEHIPTTMGVYNHRCIVEAEGMLYGFGQAGIWKMSAIMPRHISKPIDATLKASIDRSQFDKFHGAYDPVERTITWFYVATGDTQPKDAIVYDLDSGEWMTRSWSQGIVGSAITYNSSGEMYLTLCDENGYTWYQRDGFFDGVPASTSAVQTADSGATTTVIPVKGTLGTSDDMKGVVAYFPSIDETAVIQSHTSSQMTLASALSAAPAEDDAIWLGRIEGRAMPKWTRLEETASVKTRLQHVSVLMVPSTTGTLDLRVYGDFSANALTAQSTDQDKAPDGVTITNGSTVRTIAMTGGDNADGQADVPAAADFKRTWRWDLRWEKPLGTVRILAVQPVFSGGQKVVLE